MEWKPEDAIAINRRQANQIAEAAAALSTAAHVIDPDPGPTWDRLRKVKRRYDPDNLFRLNHNIPPAEG